MITLSIFEPFLQSKVETERAMAAFQVPRALAFHTSKHVALVSTSLLGIQKKVDAFMKSSILRTSPSTSQEAHY